MRKTKASKSRAAIRRSAAKPPVRGSRIPAAERERLLAEARKHSRMLRNDPREQTLLDELESIQADNAHVAK
jgi:hypothetical protein